VYIALYDTRLLVCQCCPNVLFTA